MAPTLYYTPTSCAAASFISAFKADVIGSKLNVAEADIRTKKILTGTMAGEDYLKVNPKGNVPTIQLEDGSLLYENVATLLFVGDLNPESGLTPPQGSIDRYHLINKLAYLATEMHKGIYAPLFTAPAEIKAMVLERSKATFKHLNDVELHGGKKFLFGNHFTVADAYLYIILSWSAYVQVDLSPYENVTQYSKGIAELDFVKAAHAKIAELGPK